jgi:D-galactarolactone isomerase
MSGMQISRRSFVEGVGIAAMSAGVVAQMAWGSDWPHPNLGAHEKPNDALLFDLLCGWAPKSADRDRILVQNPQVLYGFPKSA